MKLRSVIFTFCILLECNAILYAQGNNISSSKIIPPSPNSATLLKFIDIPVNKYTGTSSISIPIFNIEAKGLNVPITINYHTGGIKLKEEAGWVGLGWALDYGGVISRTIMDKDDFSSNTYFTPQIPEIHSRPSFLSGTAVFPFPVNVDGLGGIFFCNYNVPTASGTYDFSNFFSNNPPFYDAEPDLFNYSYPGGSGKFIISRNRKVILQKQSNVKINFDENANYFTITDEKGNRYLFSDIEYTSTNANTERNKSSWLLTKIITSQNDSITYKYTSDNTWTYSSPDLTETIKYGCATLDGYSSIISAPNLYLNITISQIEFKNGKVVFDFDSNSRTDLLNGKKLNRIKVFSKVDNQFKFLRQYEFNYSFFNDQFENKFEYTRLRLDSLVESTSIARNPAHKFIYFDFQGNKSITGKNSFSVDHWGYFNNKSNSTFIPVFRGYFDPPGVSTKTGYKEFPGADRTPVENSMKLFSLSEIIYPSGGKTKLETEAHQFDIKKSIHEPLDFPEEYLIDTTVSVNFSGRGIFNSNIDLTKIFQNDLTVNITFRSNKNDSCAPYRNTTDKIFVNFGGLYRDINSSFLKCPAYSPICTSNDIKLNMNGNNNPLSIYIDPSINSDFAGITITFRWKEKRGIHFNNWTSIAGGLRIKSISNFNSTGSFINKIKYEYLFPNEGFSSSGKLMSFPSYARYEPGWILNNYNEVYGSTSCISLTRSSSSNSNIFNGVNGNSVGYSFVTESQIDSLDIVKNGKKEFLFINNPDTANFFHGYRLPGLLNMYDNMNGLPISENIYKQTQGIYKLLHSKQFEYITTNRDVIYSMKYQIIQDQPATLPAGRYSSICPGDTGVQHQVLVNFYPSIKSEKILLKSQTEKSYSESSIADFIERKNMYYYDNPKHFQLTRSISEISNGSKIITKKTYPQDFLNNNSISTSNIVLDSMISKNMVENIVESIDSLIDYQGNFKGIKSANLVLYDNFSNGQVAIKNNYVAELKTLAKNFDELSLFGNQFKFDNKYSNKLTVDDYDNAGNILQITASDQIPVSFIWNYEGGYPISKVINSTFFNTAYTSFEADASGNWDFNTSAKQNVVGGSITGNAAYPLSSGYIQKSGLNSSLTYKVSCWIKEGTGNVLINGSVPQVVLAKKGWTLYQAEISNASVITISGSGLIDEVRLCPSKAQMSTFTYEPLIGMTSKCDVNNRIEYYEYDSFGRLKLIRDFDGNIIKSFDYQYQANQ